MQSQRPMSSSEGEAAPAGPVQEPSDRWLGGKGPGHINVAVQYTVSGDGDISSSWEVDTSKAIPSKLPMFMYRYRVTHCLVLFVHVIVRCVPPWVVVHSAYTFCKCYMLLCLPVHMI